MGREIKARLKLDRQAQAEKAADAVESYLEAGELKEAWRSLKGWYAEASDKAAKPCYESMQKQTKERTDLNKAVPPPGAPIPINVEPFDINDEVPGDMETRGIVAGMKNGRAGGSGGIKAEHLKVWFSKILDGVHT